MASSGKKKTTMAKLNRERKLRERRLDKKIKKDARKRASDDHGQSGDVPTFGDDQSIPVGDDQSIPAGDDQSIPAGSRDPLDPVVQSPADV